MSRPRTRTTCLRMSRIQHPFCCGAEPVRGRVFSQEGAMKIAPRAATDSTPATTADPAPATKAGTPLGSRCRKTLAASARPTARRGLMALSL
jgi:hypothetical protein